LAKALFYKGDLQGAIAKYEDYHDDLGTEVSGFLGFTMVSLPEIKIDYRDDLVDFTYKYNLAP
jgi:hypothetical protein